MSASPATFRRVLRIATRRSPLALWQAEHVAGLLSAVGVKTEIVPLESGGDTDMRPIDGTRQVGLFTKRIQQAVLAGEADVAVHSLKDLPTEPNPDFALAAVPERETVRDCLVSATGMTLNQLPDGARVGTGSRRRAAQLLSLRGDLEILPIRGNVQTRLAKLDAGEFSAIVLAEAGLRRLRLHELPLSVLPLDQVLPAPGQGALGIETRGEDREAAAIVNTIEDAGALACVTAERHVLAALHGGCLAPIAALGTIADATLTLRARVLSSDGSRKLDVERVCELGTEDWQRKALEIARSASDALIADGARKLVHRSRDGSATVPDHVSDETN